MTILPKTVYLPQRTLEHQAALAEFHQYASTPAALETISTQSLLADALPDLPAVSPDETFLIDIQGPIVDSLALLDGSDLESVLAALDSSGAAVDFFGIEENAERYVILIDCSNSMFERSRNRVLRRFDFQTIKAEAQRLVEQLNANTLFNVAIYEGGSLAWKPYLVPGNTTNKHVASEWIQAINEHPSASISSRRSSGPKLIEGGGTRLDTGLKQAFSFDPDVIFVVTDGEINRGNFKRIPEEEILQAIDELQSPLTEKVRIHLIHYETAVAKESEIAAMRAIASRNQGQFRRIKATELD